MKIDFLYILNLMRANFAQRSVISNCFIQENREYFSIHNKRILSYYNGTLRYKYNTSSRRRRQCFHDASAVWLVRSVDKGIDRRCPSLWVRSAVILWCRWSPLPLQPKAQIFQIPLVRRGNLPISIRSTSCVSVYSPVQPQRLRESMFCGCMSSPTVLSMSRPTTKIFLLTMDNQC